MEKVWPVEKRMLQKTVREFMNKECSREFVRDLDENPRFPWEIVNKSVEVGLTGLRIPEEYGGTGGDLFDLTIAHEEMARVSVAVGNAIGVAGSWGAHKIAEYGTEEQKRDLLPRIARGELVFSAATTESDGGTNVVDGMQTTATDDGDSFIINGEKMFISAAHVADYIVVTCITDPDAKRVKGMSQILVEPKKDKGIEVTPIPKMSIKASGYNVISFKDVKVPKSNLLGELNKGWWQLVSGHNRHNLINAAQALGIARTAYLDALAHAKGRKTFGRPIGQYQSVQTYLTEMAAEIDIARNYLYYTAQKAAAGEDYTTESFMLNKFSSEVTLKTVNNAMSIYGAYGLTTELDIQRHYRDARHFITTPMPNEMVVNRLAMCLGLPKSY